TVLEPGTYLLRLSASDALHTSTSDVTIVANAPNGAVPTVAITGPVDGDEITKPTNIVGSVSDGYWKLEYALGGDDQDSPKWVTFASGTGAINNATIASFDPTLLLNGSYGIRLTAITSGGTASKSLGAMVTRNMKVGLFTLTFDDLDVAVTGLPIQVL